MAIWNLNCYALSAHLTTMDLHSVLWANPILMVGYRQLHPLSGYLIMIPGALPCMQGMQNLSQAAPFEDDQQQAQTNAATIMAWAIVVPPN